MGEYISREAVISEACAGCSIDFPCEPCEPQDCEIKARLEAIPAADVAPVRHGLWMWEGRWMWDGGEDMHYYCSLCHHNAYGNTGEILDGEYKYCPSCGAVMDGGQAK